MSALLLLAAALSGAQAGELALGVGVSGSGSLHYPAVGPSLGVEWRPAPVFAFGVTAAANPEFDDLGRVTSNPGINYPTGPPPSVYPPLYEPTLRAEALLRFNPMQQAYGAWWTSVGVALGFGAVRTVDDIAALQAEFDPRAYDTQRQWHPTTLLAVSGEARRDGLGLRFTVGRLQWIETISSTTLELTWPTVVQVELLRIR